MVVGSGFTFLSGSDVVPFGDKFVDSSVVVREELGCVSSVDGLVMILVDECWRAVDTLINDEVIGIFVYHYTAFSIRAHYQNIIYVYT